MKYDQFCRPSSAAMQATATFIGLSCHLTASDSGKIGCSIYCSSFVEPSSLSSRSLRICTCITAEK